jgi:hypothetical protein
MKTLFRSAALAALVVLAAAAQTPGDFLDYFVVKVKPEKRVDFDALLKKMVDANRKNNGDQWLALETVYGENNTIAFASARKDMASIDTASEVFKKAMQTSFGANYEAIFHDLDACTASSHSEIRRRLWDLTTVKPEEYAQKLGAARWLSTSVVKIKPGTSPDFEDMARTVIAAEKKAGIAGDTLVSQAVAGGASGVYYFTTLAANMAGLDPKGPSLKEALGDEGWAKYQKTVADTVIEAETMITRVVPELSNPPEEVMSVTRDFWTPKPAASEVAARAKQPKKAKGKY